MKKIIMYSSLIFVFGLSLFLSGCGKKEENEKCAYEAAEEMRRKERVIRGKIERLEEESYKKLNEKDKQEELLPCKLSIWVQRADDFGKKNNWEEDNGIPLFLEYLLDPRYCDSLGVVKSQTTYGFEDGEVFLELYKLPWKVSDNFNGENHHKPVESFDLSNF